MMSKKCDSPNKLTEFGPFITEESNTITNLFTRLFGVRGSSQNSPKSVSLSSSQSGSTQNVLDESASNDEVSQEASYNEREKSVDEDEQSNSLTYEDTSKSQRLINVLKRVKNIVALKNSEGLQSYESTQLRRYWMPDSACYECYDCTEPFNTFRRRHHCRLCGQVFCAACCNQKLPGRIINCQGDLKVCTFCCKIILSYLHSPNVEAELTADMRALQVDLQSKFGVNDSGSVNVGPKKKYSGGYQEERFGPSRNATYNISLSDPDRKDALRSSSSLRALYQELVRPGSGITFTQHRYRLRCYVDVVPGTDIVHWLIEQQKAGNRNQAHAICQALLDAEYIECPTDENSSEFLEQALYQAKYKESVLDASQSSPVRGKLPLSCSTFCLDLDVQGHSAYLCKPSANAEYVSDLESPDAPQVPIVQSDRTSVGSTSTNPSLPEKSKSTETEVALWQSYKRHEDALLAQLLGAAHLSYDQWAETVKRLCDEIVETIRPEESEDFEDTQDVRQYVQFKKVPGGAKSDCEIVSGVACSKNASHRDMRSRIRDPKILLLQCAIVYQRVEGRFFSLEPVMRQENDYIANVTARVLALRPDVVLVQRSVSRLAQELLRTGGVTLALGVRVSVLERIARCTEADIVTSVDTHFGQPRLGTCSEFSVQCFDVGKRTSKSLMFFENCARPQLGCTVLLRGADKRELSRLKSVMRLMLLARYNWKLELAYLLDEGAKPPGPKRSLFDTKENTPDSEECDENFDEEEIDLVTMRRKSNNAAGDGKCLVVDKKSSAADKNKVKSGGDGNGFRKYSDDDSEVFDSEFMAKSNSKNLEENENKVVAPPDDKIKRASNNPVESTTSGGNLLVERVSDFSDPLRSAMEDDEVFEIQRRKDSVHTMSEQQPFDNRFRLALSHSVLSVSPFLTFPLPYLESEAGRKCSLRKLFPVEMFYSDQFHEEVPTKEPETPTEDEEGINNVQLNPPHPLITHDIGSSLKNRAEIESLVASFRATGGRLPYGTPYRQKSNSSTSSSKNSGSNKSKSSHRAPDNVMDALHPANHQKLSVSLCIHSKHSTNFPGFCVNPRIINIQFYGRDDIALGNFLNKYCFNPNYLCPSGNCNTPMMQHIRRYIHDTGCLEVSLENVSKPVSKVKEMPKNNNDDIFIWSWCKRCKKSTPIAPMSNEAKLISFGKYLELRFHGSVYRPQNDCGHSLHSDHHQYFSCNGIRTCIRYVSINLWEVCLPPFIITVTNEPIAERADLINEIKTLSLQGHEVFSGINDRLNLISGDSDEKSQPSKSFAIRELSVYKARIEAVQVLLAEKAHWTQVADAIVLVKRAICEACESWNAALQGGERATSKQFPIETGHTTDEDFDQETSSILHDSSSLRFSDSEVSTPHNTPLSTRKLLDMEQNEVFAPNNGLASKSRISLPDVADYLDLEDLERKLFQSIYKPNKRSSACSSVRGSECSTPEMRHHNRVQSDGQSVLDDTTDSSDRKSLMSMFMHLKSASNNLIVSHIQCPIPINEHYLLPMGTIPIAVRENEPESIIAYALMSPDYARSLEEFKMEAYIKSQESAAESDEVNSGKEKNESDKAGKNNNQHIEVNFQDSTTSFMCRVYFAQDFERLRELVLPQDNPRISLARSLSRTTNWQARGGKSGSKFSKTLDDRYVIKQMSRLEMHIFCEFAPHYFLYMESCVSAGTPTLLGKIVGVYRVIYRNAANGGAQHQMSVLVMENLFYKQKISRRFDLKGSERNRLVENDGVLDDEAVLLDQNFMKMCCDEPLYAHWHSHAILNDTVLRDTDFLSQNCVMDYSLLVGLNQDNKTLVVGIIDYIRTFTWDKKLETIVKKTVTLGQQGKLPTVLSPDEYRKRFCQAMDRYFVSVPSRWDSLARRSQDTHSNSDKQ